MAKALQFVYQDEAYEGLPVKLERSKLYGRTETVVSNAQGEACTAASLDPTGRMVIPGGAIKNVILDENGQWLERGELVAVDQNDQPLPDKPSSFDGEIALDKEASESEFLDHTWKSVYQIENPKLAELVGRKIYRFEFSYRGGVAMDDGCLLASNGMLYLFAGVPQDFPLIGLGEQGVLDEADSTTEAPEEEISFDMM